MPPQTIQIFLPGGNPRGIRVAEITTRIVQVIEVPRSLLPDFLKMPESDQVALYFLFGEAEDGSEQNVYIGQTGDLRARLVKHNKEKEFWERALVLISKTDSLITNHALFLEWYCIQATRKAGRYVDENGNSGSRPHTPAPLEADCLEIFETGQTLLATLGYPIFSSVAKSAATPVNIDELGSANSGPAVESAAVTLNADELFFCKADGVKGSGIYTPEGFVVLKGSIGRKENKHGLIGHAYEQLRLKLLESGVVKVQGDDIIFTKDHLFSKPSPAAVALMGRPANGWLDWKTQDGKTLDALKRQVAL
ncbi:MAG: GIY-YIG nuclease family protein [Prosthecobacter sp.]